uniref:MobA/VirD2-like nuclease domain-containing protein n=1 Tax=Bosea sp. NBC_00436 TaxID=2969620 RepID=A0A9E7ZQU8_9HYPH
MISGATRGQGGRALSAHLLRAEKGQTVEVVPARGVVERLDLHVQLREIVALSAGGRTDRPVYHVHADPPPDAPDCQAALAAWWSAFEREFGLEGQPYCGAQHLKNDRRHEHRAYGLVRTDGRLVDLRNDYQRRTYVNIIVAHRLGLAPAPTPHARAVVHRLAAEGRTDILEWMKGHDLIDAPKPIAPVTPTERLVEARTGIALATVRDACLAAWKASTDGSGLERELHQRGLRLAQGRSGPVVVDASGTAHSLARAIGAASRLADGERIPAAAVKAKLTGMNLEEWNGQARRDPGRGAGPAERTGRAADGTDRGRGGERRSDPLARGGAGANRPCGESPGRGDHQAGERDLRFAIPSQRAFARARLRRMLSGVDWRAVHQAEHLAEELRAISARRAGPWVPGATDIWGVPLP